MFFRNRRKAVKPRTENEIRASLEEKLNNQNPNGLDEFQFSDIYANLPNIEVTEHSDESELSSEDLEALRKFLPEYQEFKENQEAIKAQRDHFRHRHIK